MVIRVDVSNLPSPICDLLLGNLPGIHSPSEADIMKWNKDHGFHTKEHDKTTKDTTTVKRAVNSNRK